ncbi:hypothetical protein THIOSC15_1200002 [uncultured Thiomicrorhabdus sp.]
MYSYKHQSDVMTRRYFRIDAKMRYRIESHEPLQNHNIKHANQAVLDLATKYDLAFKNLLASEYPNSEYVEFLVSQISAKLQAHYQILEELEKPGTPDPDFIYRCARTIHKNLNIIYALPADLAHELEKLQLFQSDLGQIIVGLCIENDRRTLSEFNEKIKEWRVFIKQADKDISGQSAIAVKAVCYAFDVIFCSYSTYLNDHFQSGFWRSSALNISASGVKFSSLTEFVFGAHLKMHFLLPDLENQAIALEAKVISSTYLPSSYCFETKLDFYIPDAISQFALLQQLQILEAKEGCKVFRGR